MRALELGVSIPDSLILVQVLTKYAEAISKAGGSQVAYRVASVRQELHIDHRANLQNVMEWSEFLQAECEELALTSSWTKAGAPATVPSSNQQIAVKAAALMAGGTDQLKRGSSGQKGACRYWGTATGCKKGDQCHFGHSWDGLAKQDRCFVCSGEGHFSKDCPTKKDREKVPKKAAKLKTTKEGGSNAEEGGKGEEPDVKKPEAKPKNSGNGQTSSPEKQPVGTEKTGEKPNGADPA